MPRPQNAKLQNPCLIRYTNIFYKLWPSFCLVAPWTFQYQSLVTCSRVDVSKLGSTKSVLVLADTSTWPDLEKMFKLNGHSGFLKGHNFEMYEIHRNTPNHIVIMIRIETRCLFGLDPATLFYILMTLFCHSVHVFLGCHHQTLHSGVHTSYFNPLFPHYFDLLFPLSLWY